MNIEILKSLIIEYEEMKIKNKTGLSLIDIIKPAQNLYNFFMANNIDINVTHLL